MDDETKQLLREIRDLQREHLNMIRANVKEASDVNRMVLENQTKWKQQNKQSTTWMVIIVIVILVCVFALEFIKRLR